MTLQNVLNGRPTELERERVRDHLRAHLTKPGDEVAYEALLPMVPTAGKSWRDVRFGQVVRLARHDLFKETGVRLVTVPGRSVRFPTGEQQFDHGKRGLRSSLRKMKHSVQTVDAITDDRLPDPNVRARVAFFRDRGRYLVALGTAERKAIEARVGKPDVAPQMKPPDTAE
jgi:hypothetical protein